MRNEIWGKDQDGNAILLSVEELPEPSPPDSVTPLQIRRALRQLGLKPQVDAMIETLDDEAKEAWEYAIEVRRDNELIESARLALGMSVDDADNLFRLAASLA